MTVSTTPHLNFRGDARAALTFYQSVFGGDLVVSTYGDLGQPGPEADLVVWGQVAAQNGFRVMAYDVPAERPWSPGEAPFFVSVRGDDVAEITGYWEKLSEGAQVTMPLEKQMWGDEFGMLTDRFGMQWMVNIAGSAASE